MRRRVLLAGVAAWPFAAHAQTPAPALKGAGRMPVVGFVGVASPQSDALLFDPFKQGLADLGFVPGRTLRLEERYADGNIERAQVQFAELAAIPVDVFLSPGPAATRTLVRTTTIPVVAIGLPDGQSVPGLYDSLARPGGRVTGFSGFGEEMSAKPLELLKEIVPGLKVVGVMHNATDPTFSAWGEQTVEAARRQGLEPLGMGLAAPSPDSVVDNFRRLRERGGTAVIVIRDFMTARLTDDICRVALASGVAAAGAQAEFAAAGGLFSYGPAVGDLGRRAASYVARILRGEKAADLPIQLPTTFDFVVNLATARQLGLTVPQVVLARADRTIE